MRLNIHRPLDGGLAAERHDSWRTLVGGQSAALEDAAFLLPAAIS